MAGTTASAVRTYSGTITTGQVDTITFAYNFGLIEVNNLTGTAPIYVSLDGATNPTVGGAEFEVVPGGTAAVFGRAIQPNETITNPNAVGYDVTHGDTTYAVTQVRLIATGTPAYTITGNPPFRYA